MSEYASRWGRVLSVILVGLVGLGLLACEGDPPASEPAPGPTQPAEPGPNDDPSDGEAKVGFLYVVQAEKALLREEQGKLTLRLVGTRAEALGFSDRPERIATTIETERLLRQWSLLDSPPNVAMVHSEVPSGSLRVVAPAGDVRRNPAIALELSNPREVDPGGYMFEATILGGDDYTLDTGEYREVSLFVDDFMGVLDCSMCVTYCGLSFGLACHTKSPGCECCSNGKTCPSNQHPSDPKPSFDCADASTYPSCVNWSRSGGCYNCSACFSSRKWCSSGGDELPGEELPDIGSQTICECKAGYYGDKCQHQGCDPSVDCRGAATCKGDEKGGPGDAIGDAGTCTNYPNSCDCSGVITIETGSGDGCGSYSCKRTATGKATAKDACADSKDPCCGNGSAINLPSP